ncbi:acyl-ACP desaturase [Mycobacterium sp. CVI_P3]|uniref:Acyl-ACP desaturase n=1 Tax=Mycobacterium pinniadriaticum TaxID=2994102 RepID=A0ABT3SMZ1_9MYCO|nr:acyl-ACP desaturase [Mycobacterium pinniadriaticum]MCX2933788.1 acyl-ACP desaturase [Mycobacterium pinniadriaticum]MCX2940210.1 acyl-ACP desaturase [Mycobacterium pinniadriaticum]
MAQKPVANALTLELEPVVADNLARYLETADEWYGHDYVPFDQGENFAFLGGRDWDASQVTLPSDVVDALEIILITKDNLAGYHRELVEHFLLEDKWGRWMGRWTAEENLHAIAIRNYLVVTRNFDPTANEDVRVAHVMRGYRADEYTQIETLVFMALYERAHAVFLRNLEAKIDEPVLKALVGRIAADEERHEAFFAHLVAHCLQTHRDSTIAAVARRAGGFGLVGGDIVEYTEKLHNVAQAGIFDLDASRQAVSDRIRAWGLDGESVLKKFVR